MKTRFTLDPYQALHECTTIDETTARAATVATLAEHGLVACAELAQVLYELDRAHRQARRLGLVIGRSPLRPWLARLIHTQRALRRRLEAEIKTRAESTPA